MCPLILVCNWEISFLVTVVRDPNLLVRNTHLTFVNLRLSHSVLGFLTVRKGVRTTALLGWPRSSCVSDLGQIILLVNSYTVLQAQGYQLYFAFGPKVS
jgi:hypothetical protein